MHPTSDVRPTILVLLGCFSRGVEATGPNQSMIGMVRALSDTFRFRVVAEAVPGDRIGEWGEVFGVEQLPLEVGPLGARGLRKVLSSTSHDLLISNGFFDRVFTLPMLFLRRAGLVPLRPALLAPRGEFSPGALRLSAQRKRAYMAIVHQFELLRDVSLQATSEIEADEIRAGLQFEGQICITRNIRSIAPLPPHRPRAPGAPLRVAFLSRIDRKKNLLFALERLAEAEIPVEFTIYGPISDEPYWAICQKHISRLPAHALTSYRGPVTQSEVLSELALHDLFLLPTEGENFGHAIADALLAGTPVLLSDQTPWRDLKSRGAGWDLPLSRPAEFVSALRQLASAGAPEMAAMRRAARRVAESALDPMAAATELTECIQELVGRGSGSGRPHSWSTTRIA